MSDPISKANAAPQVVTRITHRKGKSEIRKALSALNRRCNVTDSRSYTKVPHGDTLWFDEGEKSDVN